MYYTVGKSPNGIVVADFDGDGYPDIAEVDYSGINVLLNDGDGMFRTVNTGPVSDPTALAMGDFDRDGVLDLVVAEAGGYISVFRGRGNGTFQFLGWFDAGQTPSYMAVGDVNRDGIPDLVVALYSGGVSVLIGNGDATFQAPVEYAAGLGPQSVAIGDLTGDGWPDIVVANEGRTSFPVQAHEKGTMSILLNNGDGTFGEATQHQMGWSPLHIGLADVDNDGKLDAIVANHGPIGQGIITILRGNGDGTFQEPIDTGVSIGPFSFAVADMDGNGGLDLVVVGGMETCSVLIGSGNGSFHEIATFVVGNIPVAVAISDFNRDGVPDIAVANHGNRTIGIHLSRSNGGA